MASAWVAGVFGLVGALVGGLVTGWIAHESRIAAEREWIRDSRRGIYDRYLTSGERMHGACEALKDSLDDTNGAAPDTVSAARKSVEAARVDLLEVYGVVQTVARRPVVDAARDYIYRLMALRHMLQRTPYAMGMEHFETASELVRYARSASIDAMRVELGLGGSAKPPEGYNPFKETGLEGEWKRTPR